MPEIDPAKLDRSPAAGRFGRRFGAGDLLFLEGDPATEAYLLQEGRVRLVKRVGAMERSLRVAKPGNLFGEAALGHGVVHNATAVAVEAGAALVLDQATLAEVLGSDPAIGARILRELARRLLEAEDQVEIHLVRDARSKVVLTLLKLVQRSLGVGVTMGSASLAVSPMELGARAGLDVDTVKRVVQELRDAGYVSVAEERLEVPDIDALRELVALLDLEDHIARPGSSFAPTRSR
ncbi:MAG: Crp/Fnr family transcriptional regulator [Polyangiaceae bacterium]|nr:Crp/Fnr family transcriptional regulator [Polyangiaceae bacterium]